MDAQIENHLPLITSRIVFAPKVFLPPPTITSRMDFSSIDVEPRYDSPAPNRHLRPGTPSTEVTNPKRTRFEHINTALAFDKDKNLNSLSPLTEKSDSDSDEQEEKNGSEAEREIGGWGMIPKPKGEVGRPGGGGYNLFQALDWNQKTYDNIHILVVKLAREKLDITKSYRGQSKKNVQQLIEMVRKKHAFVADYNDYWPIRDMLKLHLKGRAQTARSAKNREASEAIEQIAKQVSSSGNKNRA